MYGFTSYSESPFSGGSIIVVNGEVCTFPLDAQFGPYIMNLDIDTIYEISLGICTINVTQIGR